MCRIVGFWNFNEAASCDVSDTLLSMRDTLSHGGPDDAGSFVDEHSRIALGHRRLSIIELSSLGHQPMEFEDLVITFNGEIYNYQEIKAELQGLGYSFKSHSDTEVILKAFHRWGFDCATRFRGMWAFAIWDKKNEQLTLCRDRMGVKPLYWYSHNDLFMFASELKAFHKHPGFIKELNQHAVGLYLKYSYIPSPHCIFAHTHKIDPGTFLIVKKNQDIRTHRYWNIDEFFDKGYENRNEWLARPEQDVADELENILTEGFKLRMVADVPVGMFLSGGIDSSLVTALLQKEYSTPLKTFTIGFKEKKYNEAEWARKVAGHLKTDHTELYCSPGDAFGVIQNLSHIYDEPFGDASAIPTHLVSKLARQQVKVVLSADGGDEQFCGYPRYLNIARISSMPGLMRRLVSGTLQVLSPAMASKLYRISSVALPEWKNFEDKYEKMRTAIQQDNCATQFDVTKSYFLRKELSALGINDIPYAGSPDRKSYDVLTELMRIDMKVSLIDDMLTKVDRAAMSVALENREPLLDNKIIEYSSQMPSELKYKNGSTKYILRKILYKYVPKELMERPKMGFEVPIHSWFKEDLKEVYANYLSNDRITRSGIFNPAYVEALRKAYFDDKMVDANKLWLLCNFEMWKEKWLD